MIVCDFGQGLVMNQENLAAGAADVAHQDSGH
jgi:hypothetical protein